jgi:pimeloyl-ACP methyl ester carboxylesterase
MGLLVLTTTLLLALFAALALRDRPAREALGERRIAPGEAGAIEYFAHGSGPPVVLLASFARSASDFNELAAALNQAGYRTLAVQSRGVNGSALGGYGATLQDFARDIVSVLQAEQVSAPVAIVGHAYGNRVARSVATDFPARVDRLVLLGGGGGEAPPPEIGRAVGTALFGFWSAHARHESVAKAFFADGQDVPPYWETGWYPLTSLIQGRASAVTPFAEWGDGGKVPVLIVQALSDRLAPPAVARRLLERHPTRVTWREIADAGHAMLPEQPAQVAREVLEFLRPLPEAAARQQP